MIIISRKSRYQDKFRAYKVFVDNKEYCEIKDGEVKQIELKDGIHKIYCKIDWCQSETIIVETSNGKDTKIVVSSFADKFWKIPLGILYVTVFMSKYITIEEIE